MIGIITGILGMGVALAGTIHYGALFDDLNKTSKKHSRDISRIRDAVDTIGSRVASMQDDGNMALSHGELGERVVSRNDRKELQKLKQELEQLRDTSPYTEEGEQAVLEILARQQKDVAEHFFERKKEKVERNLQKFYAHFKLEGEKSDRASEMYESLMEDWRAYGNTWVNKDEDPEAIKQRFFERNEQFKEEIIELLGEDLAAKYIRTILPNRRFRKKLFGVK